RIPALSTTGTRSLTGKGHRGRQVGRVRGGEALGLALRGARTSGEGADRGAAARQLGHQERLEGRLGSGAGGAHGDTGACRLQGSSAVCRVARGGSCPVLGDPRRDPLQAEATRAVHRTWSETSGAVLVHGGEPRGTLRWTPCFRPK